MIRIIVTGGLGFIGSNLINDLVRNKNFEIHNIDAGKIGSDFTNIKVSRNDAYIHHSLDLKDLEQVDRVYSEINPKAIYHLAAESHVDRSIQNSINFVESNIVGTSNLLECLRLRSGKRARLIHVSTDEVYGTLNDDDPGFTEETPFKPNNPYSATKAAADMLVRSYHLTYGLDVISTHCSNNYGPHQHNEKLIPKVINCCLTGSEIPIYGDGSNVRDWLYVSDHVRALKLVMSNGIGGERYNIGGGAEITNLKLVEEICNYINKLNLAHVSWDCNNLITFITDRPSHDYRYAIDDKLIRDKLGYVSKYQFEIYLKRTVQFYLDKFLNERIHK